MITIDDLQALSDKAICERLDSSVKHGNKLYGLDNSDFPLIGDNTLAICQITTQVNLAEKIQTMSYDLFQNSQGYGFNAMIPNTYNVSIVHTNNGTNDIIITISAIFTTF
jgi:hypothetical protein